MRTDLNLILIWKDDLYTNPPSHIRISIFLALCWICYMIDTICNLLRKYKMVPDNEWIRDNTVYVPANEIWRYTLTPPLIGWAHTQNDSWMILLKVQCKWIGQSTDCTLTDLHTTLQYTTELHTTVRLGGVLQGCVCDPYGWHSTQPNRPAHNPAVHHRVAHNRAARWCAAGLCAWPVWVTLYTT